MTGVPVITRPTRGAHVSLTSDGAQTPPVFLGGPFSPLGGAAIRKPASPGSGLAHGGILPRAPVVHFFVCDFGNAKVKTFSEQFVDQLVQSGVKVYTEKFLTHQPGFQVRAASINTAADFFFQIHSKTAGRGDVRLYLNGQPKRMTRDEAVAEVWTLWRLKSGALSKEEVDVLSEERILWLLSELADVNPSVIAFDEIQIEIREAIANRTGLSKVLDKLRESETLLLSGKTKIAATRGVGVDWNREPGAQLSRCLPMPVISGLSPPLKELLNAVIDQSLAKVQALIELVEREKPSVKEEEIEDHADEIPIEGTSAHDVSVWKMMVESVDEDQIGSIRIASYGDTATNDSFGKNMPAQPFLLDEF